MSLARKHRDRILASKMASAPALGSGLSSPASDAGTPAEQLGAGVGAQVALARRESPAKGGRLLGLAEALVTEMPRTLAALEAGQLSEWRATLLVKETACLSAAERAAVDDELAADTGTFDGAGDRKIIAAARAAAHSSSGSGSKMSSASQS